MVILVSRPMGRCSPPRRCSTRGSRSPTPATRSEILTIERNLKFSPPGFFPVSARAGRATSVWARWTLDWRYSCLLSVPPIIKHEKHHQFTQMLSNHAMGLQELGKSPNALHYFPHLIQPKSSCLISICLQWKTWHWASQRPSLTCCGATSRAWQWMATQTLAASLPGRRALDGGR